MKKNILITLGLYLIQTGLLQAQEVSMILGGQAQTGEYDTEPLEKFTKIKWKTELDVNGGENFILCDNVLYLNGGKGKHGEPSRKGYFYAIDADSGNIVWADSTSHFVSAPSKKDTLLFYGSDDREPKIRALNSKDGKLVWELSLEKHSCWPPAIFDDKAFFGDHNGNWYVVNNITGQVINRTKIDAGICCSPSIIDSTVYFYDLEGTLHSFDPNTFAQNSICKLDKGSNNHPVIIGDTALLLDKTGYLVAINVRTSERIWDFKIDDVLYRSPAVSQGIAVIVSTKGYIYAVSTSDGSLVWSTTKSGQGYKNPAIAGNVVYIGWSDKYLYAFDLHTGEELWKFKAESAVSTPLVDNRIIYFISGKYVYAIE